jgi:hypothetical protein
MSRTEDIVHAVPVANFTSVPSNYGGAATRWFFNTWAPSAMLEEIQMCWHHA